MVRLTILSDKICTELGNAPENDRHEKLTVNTRKELCAAFVDEMNVTTVNYTLKKENYSRRCDVFYLNKHKIPPP